MKAEQNRASSSTSEATKVDYPFCGDKAIKRNI